MTSTNSQTPDKLFWVDLEMTGIDPESQRIIEIAAIVTDSDLNELGRYAAVIHQDEDVLSAAEDWPLENMKTQFEESRNSDKSEEEVVAELLDFIHDHYTDEEDVILAGNSIHQDRRFIRTWWPNIEGHLHYRMFDVSTLKIWVQMKTGESFEKTEEHRAEGDIEASISELKWCLEKLAS